MSLLEIKDLRLNFGVRSKSVPVLDAVSIRVEEGETLCLVGESGSGKSVTAMSIARLLATPPAEYVSGQVLLNGVDVLTMDDSGLRKIRGGVVSYVFQDPNSSLNPVLKVGYQIMETLRLHRAQFATREEVLRLLKEVGIPAPETRIDQYAHQLSGGMKQRVMIAMAIASQPRLLVADEPTTALDVTIQAQILELLQSLKQSFGMSLLLITHNVGIVAQIADRIAVMYAGEIVESGPASQVLARPAHPYTQALLRSVPQLGEPQDKLVSIPGTVPRIGAWPVGCRFNPRCPKARDWCVEHHPDMLEAGRAQEVRCPFWDERGD